jgi:hypothetical protein
MYKLISLTKKHYDVYGFDTEQGAKLYMDENEYTDKDFRIDEYLVTNMAEDFELRRYGEHYDD